MIVPGIGADWMMRRALSMVRECLALRRAELETDWQLAPEKKAPQPD